MSATQAIDHPTFSWPQRKQAALSLSFDDARGSQPIRGIPILNEFEVRATFYVSMAGMDAQLGKWEQAVEAGHEIGNHTLTHPCSGNFSFSRHKALEDYTLDQMEDDLLRANEAIKQRLGLVPTTFAYPCGQKFVGRGEAVRSYVPLVARHFLVGRSAFDEVHNDPTFVDLAQANALDADGGSFEHLRTLVEQARADGGWLILLGHEISDEGRQTVQVRALESLCRYVQDPANGIWVGTVAKVGEYIHQYR